MNSAMTRPLDRLGRLCLPKEICKSFNINPGDKVEISAEKGIITMRKADGTQGLNLAVEGMKAAINNADISDVDKICMLDKLLEIKALAKKHIP